MLEPTVLRHIETMQRSIETLRATSLAVRASMERMRSDHDTARGSARRAADARFSEREIRILQLMAAGADNETIAERLHFGYGTIKLHVREILEKLGAANRTEAAVRAVRLNII